MDSKITDGVIYFEVGGGQPLQARWVEAHRSILPFLHYNSLVFQRKVGGPGPPCLKSGWAQAPWFLNLWVKLLVSPCCESVFRCVLCQNFYKWVTWKWPTLPKFVGKIYFSENIWNSLGLPASCQMSPSCSSASKLEKMGKGPSHSPYMQNLSQSGPDSSFLECSGSSTTCFTRIPWKSSFHYILFQ